MKTVFLFATIMLFATTARAQVTMSPLTTSCGKKCNESFRIQNNSISPIPFTVEAHHTTFDADGPQYSQLLPSERITFGKSSGRLQPREIREIDFKLVCETNCNIAVFFIMGGSKTGEGINMKFILTHQIYSGCSKAANCRTEVLTAAGLMPKK